MELWGARWAKRNLFLCVINWCFTFCWYYKKILNSFSIIWGCWSGFFWMQLTRVTQIYADYKLFLYLIYAHACTPPPPMYTLQHTYSFFTLYFGLSLAWLVVLVHTGINLPTLSRDKREQSDARSPFRKVGRSSRPGFISAWNSILNIQFWYSESFTFKHLYSSGNC